MKDFRNVIFVLIVLLVILQIIVMKKDKEELPSTPVVAVSTFALYDITKHIAGDSIEIVNILPFGVDAHSFEPTPKLMAALEKSSLVIYSGAGLEPWTKNFNFNSKVLDMSKNVSLRELKSDEFDQHAHHDSQCAHNSVDPHYWLDLKNMKTATEIITNELIDITPSQKSMYLKNRDEYIEMLIDLNQDYQDSLYSCRHDTIITNHNAFSYLAARYSFKVEALSGLSPESEPSAKDMRRLMEHIREENVSVIFFESFVSDKVMKSIAKDLAVTVDVLQPLGNITATEAEKNLSYEDIMRDNLFKLHKALECH